MIQRFLKLLSICSILLSLGLLSGCEDFFVKDIPLEDVDQSGKLNIEAYLKGGDSSFVYITRTYGVLERDTVINVPGARLELRINGREVGQWTEIARQVNTSRFGLGGNLRVSEYATLLNQDDFLPGNQVELIITTPEGETVRGTQVVPGIGSITSINVLPREQNFTTTVTFTIQDPPGENAFFVTGNSISYFWREDFTSDPPVQVLDSFENILSFETGTDIGMQFYGNRFSVTDAGFPNASASFPLISNINTRNGCEDFGNDPECDALPRPKVRLRLVTVNRSAGDYWDAIFALYNADGNPFVEPIVLPSSFENAFGVMVVESAEQTIDFEMP